MSKNPGALCCIADVNQALLNRVFYSRRVDPMLTYVIVFNLAVFTAQIPQSAPALDITIKKDTATSQPMTEMSLEQARTNIQSSENQTILLNSLVRVAESKNCEDITLLIKYLKDPDNLLKIDNKSNWSYYSAPKNFLNIIRILASRPDGLGESALLELYHCDTLKKIGSRYERARKEAIINSFKYLNNPSDEVIAVLEQSTDPKNVIGGVNFAVIVAAYNGSKKTADFLERILLSDKYSKGNKIEWLKKCIIMYRNHLEKVRLCQRLIANPNISKELKDWIVYGLFESDPEKIFGDSSEIERVLPSRQDASDEVLRELLIIADAAMKMDISQLHKDTIRDAQVDIKNIMAIRSGSQPVMKLPPIPTETPVKGNATSMPSNPFKGI